MHAVSHHKDGEVVLDVGLFLAVLKHDHERILVLFVLLGHVTIAGHVEAIQLIEELFELGMLHSIVHWDYLDPTLLQELDMSTWDIYISIYLDVLLVFTLLE